MEGIEFTDGVLRVSTGYSLKIPHQVQYASEDAHFGLSIEVPLPEVESYEEIEDIALQLQAQIASTTKLGVFAQLGVDFETTEGGVMIPTVQEPKRNQSSGNGGRSSASGGGQRRSSNGGQRRSQQRSAPKAQGRNLDVVTIDGVDYYDQRPLKDDGTYKPGAADFKSVEKIGNSNKQLWIYDKGGMLNDDVADLLEDAGIEY